ncbi:MAG TPA: SWIM zinc finger family protein [Anaerolineae bacterium]
MRRGGRRSRYNYWGDYYEYRPTIKAKGGIKAQSKRGGFGESWWAKRWIATLESFNIGARLGRGRSYARSGQVLSIDICEGAIKAKVQGSFPKPYDISIKVKVLADTDWKKLAQALSTQAIFAAKLLAGEMPREIEQSFKDAGLSLFPEKLGDLQTNCSCPDWSNPCKHIAAVYYLLGEEFDRDPFLIFKLRGISREKFIKLLAAAGETQKRRVAEAERTRGAAPSVAVPPQPLAADVASFWSGSTLPDDFFGEVSPPPVSAALPKRLGNFPFWRGTERFLDAVESVYVQASPRGLDAFLGEAKPGAQSPARANRQRPASRRPGITRTRQRG